MKIKSKKNETNLHVHDRAAQQGYRQEYRAGHFKHFYFSVMV